MVKKKQRPSRKFLGNCPICKKKFNSEKTSLLEEDVGIQTLYVECAECDSSVVLGIMKSIPGIVTTVGMLTDMRREDIERLGNMQPITADDVLEMHRYLENKK